MPCSPIQIGDGYAIVCGRGARAKPCSVCCRGGGTRLCDGLVPKRKSGTCDRPLCPSCALHPPGPPQFGSEVTDYCPDCFARAFPRSEVPDARRPTDRG